MMFGKTERKIILSEIISVDMPTKVKGISTKIFFTIACDIIETNKRFFIIDLGCTIIFSTGQEYNVVARSSAGIKGDEPINAVLLKIKSEEEIPALEKLINDDVDKYKNDFTINHEIKSSLTAKEMEEAISDALQRGSQ